tara:strand:+ start:111 stop:1556 length:1446 start_codon:yes stop_codon:yes gene_type:complete
MVVADIDTGLQQVVDSIQHLVRKPIVSTEYDEKAIKKQWKIATGVARDLLRANPEFRKSIAELATYDVDQALPAQLLDILGQFEPRAGAFEPLHEYLHLPEVPESLLTPDIFNARLLHSLDFAIRVINFGGNEEWRIEEMRKSAENGFYRDGLTKIEKGLAARRYAFSRDVKMLGFMARTLDQEGIEGIEMHVEPGYEKLLDPQNWNHREQLKDRVYIVDIDDKKYVMKERKTRLHTDQKKGKYVTTKSSQEEFDIAKQFQNAQITQDDIKLSWEKPVGYANFADGYQFTLFEFEDGLTSNPLTPLAYAIIDNRDQYEDEFQEVSKNLRNYWNHESITFWYDDDTFMGKLKYKLFGTENPKNTPKISFEEFARVKAFIMWNDAKGLLDEQMIRLGCDNSDVDGHLFRVNSFNGRPQLEIVGFDFEYFFPSSENMENRLRNYQDFKQEEEKKGMGLYSWDDFGKVSRAEKAAYFVMTDPTKN